MKNLYDLFMSRTAEQTHQTEDDAMFSKKPLGGYSCASCEKNLINLQGRAQDYYPWQKFPMRDPSERIARVGQGFSRMLSMLKPESASKFEGGIRASQQHAQPTYYEEEDALPHAEGIKGQNETAGNFYPATQQQELAYRPGSASVLPNLQTNKRKGKH